MMLELIACYNIASIGQIGETLRDMHKIICEYLISFFMVEE